MTPSTSLRAILGSIYRALIPSDHPIMHLILNNSVAIPMAVLCCSIAVSRAIPLRPDLSSHFLNVASGLSNFYIKDLDKQDFFSTSLPPTRTTAIEANRHDKVLKPGYKSGFRRPETEVSKRRIAKECVEVTTTTTTTISGEPLRSRVSTLEGTGCPVGTGTLLKQVNSTKQIGRACEEITATRTVIRDGRPLRIRERMVVGRGCTAMQRSKSPDRGVLFSTGMETDSR